MGLKGRIHSTESFGTVDGPGVRFVIFFQGCPMRCLYCHNPDTWDTRGGFEAEASSLIASFERNRSFYKKGGITVTGGEPLLQPDFLIELFSLAKGKGIHTCLDTSGIVFQTENQIFLTKLDTLLAFTDLVLLDIKHSEPEGCHTLTGHSLSPVLEFASYLDNRQIPVWIRHVVVPGLTDTEEEVFHLGELIGAYTNIEKVELLPYHTMGTVKYEKMNLDYPLKGTPPFDKSLLPTLEDIVLKGMQSSSEKT